MHIHAEDVVIMMYKMLVQDIIMLSGLGRAAICEHTDHKPAAGGSRCVFFSSTMMTEVD